jgi:hypothetical protein
MDGGDTLPSEQGLCRRRWFKSGCRNPSFFSFISVFGRVTPLNRGSDKANRFPLPRVIRVIEITEIGFCV